MKARDHIDVAIMLTLMIALLRPADPHIWRTAFAFGVLCCVVKLLVRRR